MLLFGLVLVLFYQTISTDFVFSVIAFERNGCYRNSYGGIIAKKTCYKNNFNSIGASEKTLVNTKLLIAEWGMLKIQRV